MLRTGALVESLLFLCCAIIDGCSRIQYSETTAIILHMKTARLTSSAFIGRAGTFSCIKHHLELCLTLVHKQIRSHLVRKYSVMVNEDNGHIT